MTTDQIAHPPIVSKSEWLGERLKLLKHEKELTKQYDKVSAERRRLPMGKIAKEYLFQGTEGLQTLSMLFDGCRQLIVYHFMFDPDWDAGCSG